MIVDVVHGYIVDMLFVSYNELLLLANGGQVLKYSTASDCLKPVVTLSSSITCIASDKENHTLLAGTDNGSLLVIDEQVQEVYIRSLSACVYTCHLILRIK